MATLEVLFQPFAGSPIAKSFKHKPLGLCYAIETPIKVSLVMGEAEDIGVEAGWQILRVGNQDLIGLSFEAACRALWDGANDLTESLIMHPHPPDTTNTANMILWWQPPLPCQAVEILKQFGYSALGPIKWKDVTQPNISLQLARKQAVAASAHDWYEINCRLSFDALTRDVLWVVPRRLMHLRRLLHDPVRLELGRAYDQHFKTERFATSGRPPNTQMKLKLGTWLAALARVINSCQLSPALTAAVLCFLEAPQIVQTRWTEDKLMAEAYLLLGEDDNEMPSHPPVCSEDGSKLQIENMHQVVQISDHQIVRELI